MPDEIADACRATAPASRRIGYKRPHLGRHVCVEALDEAGAHPGWHRCWCGYLWGQHGLDKGDVPMVLR